MRRAHTVILVQYYNEKKLYVSTVAQQHKLIKLRGIYSCDKAFWHT